MRLSIALAILVASFACSGKSQEAALRREAAAKDSGYAGVQTRGKVAMGVDQYTSSHVFEPLPDGGRIELQRDGADSSGTAQIREHMRQIASSFGAGDFGLPGFVHARGVPGTEVMASRRAEITYTAEELPRGGAVRIRASNADVVHAIHDFLAFQRQDHHVSGHRGA